MKLAELVARTRSCRRFKEDERVPTSTLKSLVDLARLSASGANLQPLKYILSNTRVKNMAIFRQLSWAGYLKDWPGPGEGQRPAAYIIILGDTRISRMVGCDHGIAAGNIGLGAREAGLGACMMGAVDREGLRRELNIPARYEILLVIALGRPAETAVLETVKDRDIRYWRDAEGVHHVPKRPLSEIILPL